MIVLSTVPFNTVLEALVNAMRKRKETKVIQIRKEKMKLSLFSDIMIVYGENSKSSTKNLPEVIIASLQDTKLICGINCFFFISTMNKINVKLKHAAMKLKDAP